MRLAPVVLVVSSVSGPAANYDTQLLASPGRQDCVGRDSKQLSETRHVKPQSTSLVARGACREARLGLFICETGRKIHAHD